MRKNRASPLVTRHIAGVRNMLGDIPSCSYGYKAKWHFVNDIDFLAFLTKHFLCLLRIPGQGSASQTKSL
jgi:hypothetical protein